jgi:hypothetical protein
VVFFLRGPWQVPVRTALSEGRVDKPSEFRTEATPHPVTASHSTPPHSLTSCGSNIGSRAEAISIVHIRIEVFLWCM